MSYGVCRSAARKQSSGAAGWQCLVATYTSSGQCCCVEFLTRSRPCNRDSYKKPCTDNDNDPSLYSLLAHQCGWQNKLNLGDCSQGRTWLPALWLKGGADLGLRFRLFFSLGLGLEVWERRVWEFGEHDLQRRSLRAQLFEHTSEIKKGEI